MNKKICSPNYKAKPYKSCKELKYIFRYGLCQKCFAHWAHSTEAGGEYIKKVTIPQAKKESEKMFNFYESKGWLVGKAKMKNWKAAASNWIARAETDFATKDKPAFKLNTNRPTQ